jgi:hypothetical protein
VGRTGWPRGSTRRRRIGMLCSGCVAVRPSVRPGPGTVGGLPCVVRGSVRCAESSGLGDTAASIPAGWRTGLGGGHRLPGRGILRARHAAGPFPSVPFRTAWPCSAPLTEWPNTDRCAPVELACVSGGFGGVFAAHPSRGCRCPVPGGRVAACSGRLVADHMPWSSALAERRHHVALRAPVTPPVRLCRGSMFREGRGP